MADGYGVWVDVRSAAVKRRTGTKPASIKSGRLLRPSKRISAKRSEGKQKDTSPPPAPALPETADRAQAKPEFERSAVALLDILGFKGAWKRINLSDLVGTLHGNADVLGLDLDDLIRNQAASAQPFRLTVRMVSDTIVFVATPDLSKTDAAKAAQWTKERLEARAVMIVSLLSAVAQMRLGFGETPFAVRGCISLGDFFQDDNFIIGQAIDDAASGEKWTDAAVIFLTDEASAALEVELSSSRRGPRKAHRSIEGATTIAEVPGHGDESKRTRVVVPYALPGVTSQVLWGRMDRAFGTDPEVRLKLEKSRAIHRALAASVGHSIA
jgi:hypothetical protein